MLESLISPRPRPSPWFCGLPTVRGTQTWALCCSSFKKSIPGVTVEIVDLDRAGWALDLFLDGQRADVFLWDSGALWFRDRLAAIEGADLELWDDIREDYSPGAWEAFRAGGVQWGIPAGLDPFVVYINLDRIRELKVPVPQPDWSVHELVALASQLNYPEGLPSASSDRLFGFCTSYRYAIDPLAFIYDHGGGLVDDIYEPTIPTLDDPVTVEAVQWYTDVYTEYKVTPDPDVMGSAFATLDYHDVIYQGACGVWLGLLSERGGTWPVKWACSWKMLPVPMQGSELALGGFQGYFVTKECARPWEAFQLVRFLSDHWEAALPYHPPRASLS